jgi:hypothetical protein
MSWIYTLIDFNESGMEHFSNSWGDRGWEDEPSAANNQELQCKECCGNSVSAIKASCFGSSYFPWCHTQTTVAIAALGHKSIFWHQQNVWAFLPCLIRFHNELQQEAPAKKSNVVEM